MPIPDNKKTNLAEKLYFSTGVKEYRKKSGYSQKEIADVLNVSLKTLQNWENRRACPNIDEIYALCKILDCDVDFLFGLQSCPKKEASDIHDVTGLSDSAIQRLSLLHCLDQETVDFISDLLINPLFYSAIQEFQLSVYMKKACIQRDVAGKIIRDQVNLDNYDGLKELLQNFHAETDDAIQRTAFGKTVDLSPNDLAKFYYIAAKDSFTEAISDLYKHMVKKPQK